MCVKPAAWCRGCPREKGCATAPHHFVDGRLHGKPDIIVVAEAPVMPRMVSVQEMHLPFRDDAGKIVTKALESVRAENPAYAKLNIQSTYVVMCTSNAGDKEPAKAITERCKTFLLQGLAQAARPEGQTRPVIIAMGMTAVKALGIKAAKLKDVQGRILPDIEIGGARFDVVVTISTKQLVSMAGMYTTYYDDLRHAFALTTHEDAILVPIDELTKDYVFPSTIEEVKDVCDLIIGYSESGRPPDSWSISYDTETNTKFPHREKLKPLCVSFAWATGRACAIPLWHRETPYDPALAAPHVIRVLSSPKPKSMHNGKFDLKVNRKMGWPMNNFAWCTMLGEHALEEDKKGQYGLKQITTRYFPQFAGYADHLYALQTRLEGDSQLENLRRAQELEAAQTAAALTGVKLGKKAQQYADDKGFEDTPLKELLVYAAIDTDITRRLSVLQILRIQAEEKAYTEAKRIQSLDRFRRYPVPQLTKDAYPVKAAMSRISVPVAKVLAEMEFTGVPVDRPYLGWLQSKLTEVIDEAEESLYKMVGKSPSEFSLKSAAAVGNMLFSDGFIHPETGERTFYPPVEFNGKLAVTARGQLQTTDKVMRYLVASYECPFSAQRIIFSKASKARDTFCKNVFDLSALDSRLHTNYNQHGTCTYRLSSSDENMQNIPSTLAGHSIKKAFTTSDDSYVFVNADAKSAEVKILTAYSGDKALAQSLNDGQDTHSFFAARVIEEVRMTSADPEEVLRSMGLTDKDGRDSYRLTYEDFASRGIISHADKVYGKILDKFRTAIKRVVFGILYGAGPAKIAETIGIRQDQAQTIIDMLFRLFPAILAYMEQTRWEMKTFGYVETFFGHRRRFAVKGASGYLRSRAERQCVNFKIQSTSSDIVMGRLVACRDPLVHDLKGRLLLTVHDSIGFELPKKYLSQLPDFIEKHLTVKRNTLLPWLPVDFSWDFEVGANYGELMDYNDYMQNLGAQGKGKGLSNAVAEAYTDEEVRIELASDSE